MLYNTGMLKNAFTNHRRVIISFFLLFTVVSSAYATYFVFKSDNKSTYTETVLGKTSQRNEFLEKEKPEELNTLNILLLGYGGAGHQGGFLSDVIQIAHFNFDTNKIKFISIPRDLWVGLPNNKSAKINTAFSLGDDPQDKIGSGGQIAKQMAETVTGLEIDYFIAVDFVGYKRAIGYSLDGIEVDVPETLHDPWYPIEGKQLDPCGLSSEEIAEVTKKYSGFELEKQFPCRYEEIYFPKGKNRMEGQDALNYVRSRHGSTGGDFSRSERQVAVLKAIKNKLFSLEIFDDLPEFFRDITKHTQSDIDWEIAKYLAPALRATGEYEIENVILSTENVFSNSKSNSGQFILIPKTGLNNWAATHLFIKENL